MDPKMKEYVRIICDSSLSDKTDHEINALVKTIINDLEPKIKNLVTTLGKRGFEKMSSNDKRELCLWFTQKEFKKVDYLGFVMMLYKEKNLLTMLRYSLTNKFHIVTFVLLEVFMSSINICYDRIIIEIYILDKNAFCRLMDYFLIYNDYQLNYQFLLVDFSVLSRSFGFYHILRHLGHDKNCLDICHEGYITYLYQKNIQLMHGYIMAIRNHVIKYKITIFHDLVLETILAKKIKNHVQYYMESIYRCDPSLMETMNYYVIFKTFYKEGRNEEAIELLKFLMKLKDINLLYILTYLSRWPNKIIRELACIGLRKIELKKIIEELTDKDASHKIK